MNSGRPNPIERSKTIDVPDPGRLVKENQSEPLSACITHHSSEIFRPSDQNVSGEFTCGDGHVEEASRFEAAFRWETVLEPLTRVKTGREALHEMLEHVVNLGISESASIVQIGPTQPPAEGASNSCHQSVKDLRQMLKMRIVERLEESVSDGELPEKTDVATLSTLCVSFLIGLVVSAQDETPTSSLRDSVTLFVSSLGFHTVRPAKQRHPGSQPVLFLVKP
jgi:hypothetical protein